MDKVQQHPRFGNDNSIQFNSDTYLLTTYFTYFNSLIFCLRAGLMFVEWQEKKH